MALPDLSARRTRSEARRREILSLGFHDLMRRIKDDRPVWRSIGRQPMLSINGNACRKDGACRSAVQKQARSAMKRTIEPRWIVKDPGVAPHDIRKTLKAHVNLRATTRTEVHTHPLTAAVGLKRVDRRLAIGDLKIRQLKNRLDHVARPGRVLTEAAITQSQTHRQRLRRKSKASAPATVSFSDLRHRLRLLTQ